MIRITEKGLRQIIREEVLKLSERFEHEEYEYEEFGDDDESMEKRRQAKSLHKFLKTKKGLPHPSRRPAAMRGMRRAMRGKLTLFVGEEEDWSTPENWKKMRIKSGSPKNKLLHIANKMGSGVYFAMVKKGVVVARGMRRGNVVELVPSFGKDLERRLEQLSVFEQISETLKLEMREAPIAILLQKGRGGWNSYRIKLGEEDLERSPDEILKHYAQRLDGRYFILQTSNNQTISKGMREVDMAGAPISIGAEFPEHIGEARYQKPTPLRTGPKVQKDELSIARAAPYAIDAGYLREPDFGVWVDFDHVVVHLFQYEDGTWWWRRGYGRTVEDEDDTGRTFEDALQKSMEEYE